MRIPIGSWLLAGAGLVLGESGVNAASITSDLASPQLAGTAINFTVNGADPGQDLYQLRVGPSNDPGQPGVVYDFSQQSVFQWTPIDPGTYRVIGLALDRETGQTTSADQFFTVMPAVPDGTALPAMLSTSNPLVALYVAPPCIRPAPIRVSYFEPSLRRMQNTSPKPCVPGTPTHFLVAGMRENSTYQMEHQLLAPSGALLSQVSRVRFTTGTAEIQVAPNRQTVPYDRGGSLRESVIWNSPILGNQSLGLQPYSHATDLDGHLIWYAMNNAFALRPSRDGTFWYLKPDPIMNTGGGILAKMDVLGNVVKQTSLESMNYQLGRLGYADRITDFHHDVRDLPNGDFAFLATIERVVSDVQGPGEVSVLADLIIVTNKDFEIRWVWNGWDHLDPTRLATLGEKCTHNTAGCSPFYRAETANDWMHSNGLAYTLDGNLLLSVRNQDWLVKINYAHGTGDGRILWRLGRQGDFRLVGATEENWFSHTHDPSFIDNNRIIVFDNSNLRCGSATPPPNCQSRGQLWEIDERAMTAELVFNKELGGFSSALGAAQLLQNGNYWFNSGLLGTFAAPRTTLFEMAPNGTTVTQTDLDMFQYRSYRLLDLYTTPAYWDRHWQIGHQPTNGCGKTPGSSCPPAAIDTLTPSGSWSPIRSGS